MSRRGAPWRSFWAGVGCKPAVLGRLDAKPKVWAGVGCKPKVLAGEGSQP